MTQSGSLPTAHVKRKGRQNSEEQRKPADG